MQICNVQVNLSVEVIFDALCSENFVKSLKAFISKLHFENGSQDFSGTTRPILCKFAGLMLKSIIWWARRTFLKKNFILLLFTKN